MLCAKELALAILTDEFPVLLVGITALADTAGTFALLIRDGRGRTRVCVEAVLLMGREGGRRGRAVHRAVCGHVLMDRRRKQRHGSQGTARLARGFLTASAAATSRSRAWLELQNKAARLPQPG